MEGEETAETETMAISSSPSNYGSISDDRDTVNEEAHLDVQFRAEEDLPSTRFRRCGLKSLCRIEFAAFIMTLSYGLHGVIRTNLLIEKTCRVDLNFGDAICDDIDNQTNQQEQDMVQERVNDINLYFTFISSVPW